MVEKIQKNGKEKKEKKNIRNALPVIHHPHGAFTPEKFIDPETLNISQSRTSPLNNISAQLQELGRVERDVTLCMQHDFESVVNALQEIVRTRRMLDELMQVSYGISSEQLDAAHEEQKRSGGKLGEVLVRLGFIDQRELDEALNFQFTMDEGKIPFRPSWLLLGELLIHTGYIQHEHLSDALDRQRKSGKKIGEILVEAGYVQRHHIEHGLRIQKHLAAAVMMAALSLAPVEKGIAAQSSPVMSTQIQVTATVMARASMHILRQPAEIIVTDADIKRGFLDVNDGSLIEVRNNTRSGVNLTFNVDEFPFKEALISGFGREVALGPNGGIIAHQITGVNILELFYRFVFDENIQPGTYAWPLAISVSPSE